MWLCSGTILYILVCNNVKGPNAILPICKLGYCKAVQTILLDISAYSYSMTLLYRQPTLQVPGVKDMYTGRLVVKIPHIYIYTDRKVSCLVVVTMTIYLLMLADRSLYIYIRHSKCLESQVIHFIRIFIKYPCNSKLYFCLTQYLTIKSNHLARYIAKPGLTNGPETTVLRQQKLFKGYLDIL